MWKVLQSLQYEQVTLEKLSINECQFITFEGLYTRIFKN